MFTAALAQILKSDNEYYDVPYIFVYMSGIKRDEFIFEEKTKCILRIFSQLPPRYN